MNSKQINKRLKKYKKSGRNISSILEKDKQKKYNKKLLNYSKDKEELIEGMNEFIKYAKYKIANLNAISLVIKNMYNEEHEDFLLCKSYMETLEDKIKSFKDTIDICERKPDNINVLDASEILNTISVSVLGAFADISELDEKIKQLEIKYKESTEQFIKEIYKEKDNLISSKPMEFIEDPENTNEEETNSSEYNGE